MGYEIRTDFSAIKPAVGGARQNLPVSDAKGWLGRITLTEANENSAGNGMVLHVVFTADEGPVAGQSHDHYINIAHPKPETVKWAQEEMSAIAHVLGHIRVNNTDEWLNKPLRAVISPDKKNTEYPDGTRLTAWRTVNGDKPGEAGLSAGASNGQQAGAWGGQQTQQQPANNFQQQPQQQTQQQPQGGQGGPSWNNPAQGGQQGGFQQQQPQGGGFDPNASQQGGQGGFQQQPNQGGGFQQQPQQQQPSNPQQGGMPPINQNGNGANWNGGQQTGGAPGWAGQQG